jgi:short-subunit dehydrogenase
MNSFVMITGATGGLGSAFSAECASRGFSLVLTDLSPDGVQFANRIAERYGVEVRYYPCDFTSEVSRGELVHQLKADGLKFWSLINVAGLDFEGAYLGRTRKQILTLLNVNLVANMDMTHEISAITRSRKAFSPDINTCSMAGFLSHALLGTYAATSVSCSISRVALREEVKDFGSVTALCPGGMPTTPDCMRAIFVQGFWGWATTLDAQVVARAAIKAGLKGRAICIPGFANKFVNAISSLVPVSMKIHFVANRWRTTQRDIAQQDFLDGRGNQGWFPQKQLHNAEK